MAEKTPTPAPAPVNTIAKALLNAQMQLTEVGKDSTNEFHRFDYVSADAMVEACRKVLHANGLVARRKGWSYATTPESVHLVNSKTGEEMDVPIVEVTSVFVITLAETGESETDSLPWKAIPEKGRPLDKAIAGALTTCLSYWLLGMLQVPRKDENEMNTREDEGEGYTPRSQHRANAPKHPPAQEGKPTATSRKVEAKPESPTVTLTAAKQELIQACKEWGKMDFANAAKLATKVLFALKVTRSLREATEDITGIRNATNWVRVRITESSPLSVLDGEAAHEPADSPA